MDGQVNTILDLLDEYGIAENTLVVFFSDNGGTGGNRNPGDNGELRGRKANLWEGGIRSPFIARWPRVIPAGSTTDAFLSSLELMPTLAEVANTWVPDATMDGHNMLPVLKGEAKEGDRKEMFWQWLGDRAARVGKHKWVSIDGEEGLYDLSNDIQERKDLSDEKPKIISEIKYRWGEWRREMDNAEPRGPFQDY